MSLVTQEGRTLSPPRLPPPPHPPAALVDTHILTGHEDLHVREAEVSQCAEEAVPLPRALGVLRPLLSVFAAAGEGEITCVGV